MRKTKRSGYDRKYLAGVQIWHEWLKEAEQTADTDAAAECTSMITELTSKNTRLVQALDVFDQLGLGTTFAHEGKDAWAVIILDTLEDRTTMEGASYRYQLYDRQGFIGHGTYPCPYAAIAEAFDMGYVSPCPAQLDEIASSCLWQQGRGNVQEAEASWLKVVGSD
ncbi:hypothetical protein QEL91_004152 [Pseudomonas putida]|nr:hypothetical protein [Pseudomonas putida]